MQAPKHEEIDHRPMKLIVGIIALGLPSLTSIFADSTIPSISASYYEGGWSQTIFIGFLFAIAAFLMAYNGVSRTEMILSKVASIAALGVALFPCECSVHVVLVANVHGVSAAVMFCILAFFCREFYRRACAKGYKEALRRARIYVICGVLIMIAIIALAFDYFSDGSLTQKIPRFVFYGEAIGLVAFGVSWLTASRTFPVITSEQERFHPLGDNNPDK
jgi:hypothetical protein